MSAKIEAMRLPFVSRKAYNLLKKEKKEIDWLMWFVGILGPLFTIPQIYTIYTNKNAANISLITWVLYAFTNMVALLYAIIHRLKPLIITNALWQVINGLVIAGIIIYG